MANALIPGFYGTNMIEYARGVQGASLQLHITAECDQVCKHCYMYNSPFYSQQKNAPLEKQELFNLIDEYFSFLAEYSTVGFIAITGGDPILSPHFFELLRYINNYYGKRCTIAILGNPYHIFINEAKKMYDLGVSIYQISIDGLKETHDSFRKKGSFDDSLRALKVLHDAGIRTGVLYTLSKSNAHELIPLADFLSSLNYVDSFGFDRLVPTGNGAQLKDDCFTPDEYKQFLFDVYKHEVIDAPRLIIGKKDQMWRPLFFELGLFDPLKMTNKKSFITGCNCGTGSVSILADGTMFACRRLELPSGKYPEKSFKELFAYNKVTSMYRQYEKYKGCSSCAANIVCRGCPAIKYASTGDFYGKDPGCWRAESNA